MPPTYPLPPNPQAPPPRSVRVRRGVGRVLAAVSASGPQQTPAATRILLIRPDHLGDLLFLGPALRWLRQQAPALDLTLAIGPWGRPALPGLSGGYDHLIEIPFPAFERGQRAGLAERWSLLPRAARTLRQERFDAAIVFRPDHWWGAMLAAWAGIPRRIGYVTPETTPWLTAALPLPHEHAAASNLRLAGQLLGRPSPLTPDAAPLHFSLTAADRAAASSLLASRNLQPSTFNLQPLIILHPGAGAAVKLWEPDKWGGVARQLHQEGAAVVVTGGPDEQVLAAAVVAAAGDGVVNLAGQTPFGVLAALLATASLVLGPDSGPLHLAVAVGTPTVHLFGPADPLRFGPWGAPPAWHRVLVSGWTCAPCGKLDWTDLPGHGCVRDITPAQVLEAARALLG